MERKGIPKENGARPFTHSAPNETRGLLPYRVAERRPLEFLEFPVLPTLVHHEFISQGKPGTPPTPSTEFKPHPQFGTPSFDCSIENGSKIRLSYGGGVF
jgi:hypothetical protein